MGCHLKPDKSHRNEQHKISMTQERCGEQLLESSLMIASSNISEEGVDGWHICTVTENTHFGNLIVMAPLPQRFDLHALRPRPVSRPYLKTSSYHARQQAWCNLSFKEDFSSTILSDHQIAWVAESTPPVRCRAHDIHHSCHPSSSTTPLRQH